MSFHMPVRVEKVLEDGAYDANLLNVVQKETKFGERLMWKFEVNGENSEVVGFTSMSPSTKAKAYRWAAAIVGDIDPKVGWGPEDLIGGECVVVLEAAEDAQGIERSRVVEVKPSRKDTTETTNPAGESEDTERGVVQIPLNG